MNFEGDAILTAPYLINHLLFKDSSITLVELWYSKKPKVSRLRIFGCTAYAYDNDTKSKFDAKSMKCIMSGCTL